MKNIILDHYHRWWWVWLIGGAIYGIAVVQICNPDGHRVGFEAFPTGVFLGVFLLMMDLSRSHARALLALPVRPAQVAWAWWLATVAIPAVAFALISCLAWGVAFLLYAKPPVVSPLVMNWLENLLLLGVTFFAVTGLPPKNQAGDWRQQMRGAFFGAFFGGTVGCWALIKDLDLGTWLGAGIFFVGTILTVLGWYRAETLVMERAGLSRGSSSPSRKNAMPSRSAEGYGGLAFLAQNIFSQLSFMGLLMAGAFLLMMGLTESRFLHGSGLNDFSQGTMYPVFVFQFLWFMCFQMFTFTTQVRHLRTLPVSTVKLAAVLVLVPLAAMLVVFYAATLLPALLTDTPLPDYEALLRSGCLLQISGATVGVPLLIWRGAGFVMLGVLMLPMIACMLVMVFFNGQLPLAATAIVSPIIIFGSFIATKLFLERSSHTYRRRNFQFGGWGGGTGR